MTANELLDDNDAALPLEVVWKECEAEKQVKLLRYLVLGTIEAEAIFVSDPHEGGFGNFRNIEREYWVSITSEYISKQVSEDRKVSLPVDDDGAGYVHIFIKRDEALLEFLKYQPSEFVSSTDAVDIALFNARGQLFGQAAFIVAFDALYSGEVSPSPTKLANHLFYKDDLWKINKPQHETLVKISKNIVKAFKTRKNI
jgi:hypothetical protein